MPYKMVIDIGKLCGSLAGAALTHRELITGSLAEHWRAKLPEGQEIPDVLQLQTWVGEDLHQIHGELTLAARNLNTELTEGRKGRLIRDSSLVRTREELIAARRIFEVIYGAGGSEAFFGEPGPQVALDPATVYEQSQVVLGNLTDPEFVPPQLRVDIGVDLTKIAQRLAGPSQELGTALAELHHAIHGANALLESKELALGRLQRRALLGARLLEAVYAYAGHEGIASRTRPSKHVARDGRSEPTGGEGGGEGETPNEEPDDQDPGTPPDGGGEPPPDGSPPAEPGESTPAEESVPTESWTD